MRLGVDRVLVTTFGFDESKVLNAMRQLQYGRLIVVLGEDALETRGYRRLVDLEQMAGKDVTPRTVNVFDFAHCFREVSDVIDEFNRPPRRVTMNVSGGTKILANAAILAAFHAGVEAYHCEDELVKLPVIIGFALTDRFSETQIAVLRALKPGDTVRAVSNRTDAIKENSVRRAVNALIRMGVVDQWLDRGELRLRVAAGQETLACGLPGPQQP